MNVPEWPESTPLATGQRIRSRREARGMSRAVLAGLVGRSPDWLKKIERGERQLKSLPILLQVASILGVSDLAELTGTQSAPVASWAESSHPIVPEIRRAMHAASWSPASDAEPPENLQAAVASAWLLWRHAGPAFDLACGAARRFHLYQPA